MESSSPTRNHNFFSRTFRAFKYRDFRLVWIGAYTSTTGSFMQQVAQSWLVLSLTNSEFYLGLISFLAQLPLMLFSLIGGVLADRIDRRRLLLFSQVVQMTSAFILTALVWVGWIEIWHFLVLAFVTGIGQAFGGPAYQALVPGLVERRDVPNAIALNSIQFNLARVTGPLLASAVLLASGAVVCFFLNGISFLAVIVTLLLIQAPLCCSQDERVGSQRDQSGDPLCQKQGLSFSVDDPGVHHRILRSPCHYPAPRIRPQRLLA